MAIITDGFGGGPFVPTERDSWPSPSRGVFVPSEDASVDRVREGLIDSAVAINAVLEKLRDGVRVDLDKNNDV
ncbi:hypothetical protein JKY72_03910 [Candidatus Gracilibacteria bacterium]|nr:hypothetical protein [Candidatus Gracilibacteria bacterium]